MVIVKTLLIHSLLPSLKYSSLSNTIFYRRCIKTIKVNSYWYPDKIYQSFKIYKMKKIISILALLIMISEVHAQLPRVIILATGGTIAGAGAASDRAGYTAGKIPIDDLIGAIPTVKKIATITGEQISSVGSQDMTIDIWKKLAVRINEIIAKKEAEGIVITHGTDTQEETSYFLDLVIPSAMPVVLTGSMRASTAISADGDRKSVV